jgi:hypothetical protein
MSRVKNYQLGDGAEIWEEVVNPGTPLEAEYLIGHSLGANFALLNWQTNGNTKLILISPLIFKKSLFNWFFRWLHYVMTEGLIISHKDLRSNKLFHGFKTGLNLLKPDYVKIIREIPKENVVIIRGKKDEFACDKDTAEFIKKEKIRLIEIEGSGHNWDGEFKKTVQTVLTEWQQH